MSRVIARLLVIIGLSLVAAGRRIEHKQTPAASGSANKLVHQINTSLCLWLKARIYEHKYLSHVWSTNETKQRPPPCRRYWSMATKTDYNLPVYRTHTLAANGNHYSGHRQL